MNVTFNIDCTPEEARAFLGLPDLTPVHDKYVGSLLDAMSGAGSLEQMDKMLRTFSPMGDAGLKLFSQMMDIGMAAGKAATKA